MLFPPLLIEAAIVVYQSKHAFPASQVRQAAKLTHPCAPFNKNKLILPIFSDMQRPEKEYLSRYERLLLVMRQERFSLSA